MGRNQAQTRGVPARIQPIACFGTAGAAPSPVVEERGVKARAKLKPEGESVQLAPALPPFACSGTAGAVPSPVRFDARLRAFERMSSIITDSVVVR